ncbi:right-handed parallel beta-helix repeat-containing protein [Allofournierella sp.]|uniref:right-handed parallel beta-helix repeat-containing protein n=1 Tax=Allofournierella sp. TaxID=1940256 RepID=UPI003AB548E2
MKRKAIRMFSFAAAAALAVGLWLPLTYADTPVLVEDVAGAGQVQNIQKPEEMPVTTPLETSTVQPSNTALAPSMSPAVPSAAEPSAPAQETLAATPTETPGEKTLVGSVQLSEGTAEPNAEPSGQPVQAPEGEPVEGPGKQPGTEGDTGSAAGTNEEILPFPKARSFSLPNNAAEETAGDTAVAKIGGTTYPTLQAAVDAAQGGAEIVLLKDIDGGALEDTGTDIQAVVTVPSDKVLTLDLAGFKVTAQLKTNGNNYAKKYVILNEGNLTIVDSSGNQSGTISNTYDASNPCTRTLKNDSGATLEIKGGAVTSAGAVALLNSGTCTISGEQTKVTSTRVGDDGGWDNAFSAIENRASGQLTITGGTVESLSRAAIFCDGDTAKVTVTGGSFSGHETYSAVNGSAAGQTITVLGGKWSSDPSPYLGQSAYVEKVENGVYTVKAITGAPTMTITSGMDLAAVLNGLDLKTGASCTLSGNITLNASAVLPRTAKITIPEGSSLTVAQGAVLTLNGTMENNGALTVKGYMTQPGKITGSGSVKGLPLSGGTYAISTPMELQWLSYLNATNQMPKTVVLKNDLDMPQGSAFQTIGEVEGLTFDGRGHIVSNLRIEDQNGYAGLFIWLGSSVVKDLTLKDCNYTTNTGTLGGVVGQAANSTFENIAVSGVITASGASYGMGGIAGSVYQGGEETTEFINCSSSVDLSGEKAYNVGSMFGTASGSKGTIGVYNCAHSGAIAVKGSMGYVFGFGYLDKSATLEIIGFTNKGTVNGEAGAISNAAGNPNTFTYKTNFADGIKYKAVKTNSGWTVYGPAQIGEVYYPTIADALAAAKPGETILVNPGTYTEPVKIEGIAENVTLKAAGEVTLTGGITGSNWTGLCIEGFTFKNCGITLMGWHASEERFFRNVTIQNNQFLSETGKGWINVNINPQRDTATGLRFLNNAFDATAMAAGGAQSLAAINLSLALNSGAAAENLVSGNQIKKTGRGIQADVVPGGQTLIIENNTIESTLLRGIQLSGAQAGTVKVQGNLVENCGTGLRLHESYEGTGTLTFEKNRFVGCAEDLWNLSPKTELDGSGNYYGGGLPRCNFSTDGALLNYKVKCESYYEDEAMKVLLAVSAAESQVDKDKVETPPVPAGAPAGTVITDENKETAVEGLNNEIAANPHAASPAQGLAKAAHEQLSEGDQVYLKIGLNDLELRADYDADQNQVVLMPAVLTFKVEPWVKPASGTEARMENNKLSGGAITFCLPVPGVIALGSQAKVEHLRPDGTVADTQWPFVEQQEGEKFLPVAATHFSDFVVTFNAYKPPESTGSTGDTGDAGDTGGTPAPTPVPYNWHGVLAQLQALGEKGALTLDVAREIAVPQYIWQQIFGKDLTVTFKRGADSFSFNGVQLKKAGFDPDNGHNLTDLAGYTTQTLGQKASATPAEAPAEQPETTAEPEPTQAPKPTEAPQPSETPQAASSTTPGPTAAQGAGPGVWLWVAIGAAALLLILAAALVAVRRRR